MVTESHLRRGHPKMIEIPGFTGVSHYFSRARGKQIGGRTGILASQKLAAELDVEGRGGGAPVRSCSVFPAPPGGGGEGLGITGV